MEGHVILIIFIICLGTANSLRCYKCLSQDGNCSMAEVELCDTKQDACFFEAKSFVGVSGETVKRGCGTSKACRQYNGGFQGSLERSMLCCSSDLCQPIDYQYSKPKNGLVCQSCIGSTAECGHDARSEPCYNNADRCIQISQRFLPGEELEPIIKGCGPSSFKDTLLAYQIGNDFAYIEQKVCSLRNCNNQSVPDIPPGQPNGLQCYTCRETGGGECGPKRLKLLNCTGIMNQCVHFTSQVDDALTTIHKGCATETMCNEDIYNKVMRANTYTSCCKKSLCNRAGGLSGLQLLPAVVGVVLWTVLMSWE